MKGNTELTQVKHNVNETQDLHKQLTNGPRQLNWSCLQRPPGHHWTDRQSGQRTQGFFSATVASIFVERISSWVSPSFWWRLQCHRLSELMQIDIRPVYASSVFLSRLFSSTFCYSSTEGACGQLDSQKWHLKFNPLFSLPSAVGLCDLWLWRSMGFAHLRSKLFHQ